MAEEAKDQALRCINLSCKSMMVYGEDFEMDEEYQEDLTDFWCNCTSTGHGPDGEGVSMQECCDPNRSCYKEHD